MKMVYVYYLDWYVSRANHTLTCMEKLVDNIFFITRFSTFAGCEESPYYFEEVGGGF